MAKTEIMELTSLEIMCRTCMCEDGIVYSIFDTSIEHENRIYSFVDMLISCTSIQVEEGDHLSKYICEECMKQLTTAFSFKQQSERADSILRKIVTNTNIENIIKIEKQEIPIIDKPIEIIDRESIKIEKQEIPTIDKPIEINNKNNSMLTSEFLNNEIQLNKNEDHNEIKQSVPEKSTKTSKIKCSYCLQKYRNKIQLNKHVRLEHLKDYCCELCGRMFRSAHGLNYHMKIHKGIKNYVCTIQNCTKRFTSKQALDKHNSTHMHAKNHLCSICGKTYPTYDGLHYHLRAHQGERPYLCMYCGKTFIQACHLKSHMWVHSGIKPHVCKACGKCYTSGHQLKKHMIKYCPSALRSNNTVSIE